MADSIRTPDSGLRAPALGDTPGVGPRTPDSGLRAPALGDTPGVGPRTPDSGLRAPALEDTPGDTPNLQVRIIALGLCAPEHLRYCAMVLHVTYTSRTRYFFDSKQFFEQRVRELGLQDLLVAMQTKGWDSFAVLAFATEYAQGSRRPRSS